jgi:hypothetical protein
MPNGANTQGLRLAAKRGRAMVEAAAVYFILAFPGATRPILTFPMADMETCLKEKAAIEARWSADGHTYRLWGHCIKSGYSVQDFPRTK